MKSTDNPTASLSALLALGALMACSPAAPTARSDQPDKPADARASTLTAGPPLTGKQLFETAIPGSNGRSCATCHVLQEHTTLLPASVQARLRANPADPLFNRIDADDPAAAVPTYEHLQKGLIRVVLPLPANMDVVDVAGQVVTPADRTIFVWRGVPTVANTALTAPYQLDGRAATLQLQAQGAVLGHSEGPRVEGAPLDRVAEFQKGIFTSKRAQLVSLLSELGFPSDKIPIPEDYLSLSPPERRGRALYKSVCEACHGSPTTDRIVNERVRELFFPVLKPDGNVRFEQVPGVGPVPARAPRPGVQIVNFGFGITSYFGQIGVLKAFNSSVTLPRYRFRFYKDGTRREAVVDLPPVPVTVSGNPLDPRPAKDEAGAPIVGPNLIPQLFTTDPGRAVITGDPADFEAFDMPQLRGAARTAPYFHDNSHETMRDVLDTYSRFVIPFTTPLERPAVHPPETPGGRKESLTPAEKDDLLRFLEKL